MNLYPRNNNNIIFIQCTLISTTGRIHNIIYYYVLYTYMCIPHTLYPVFSQSVYIYIYRYKNIIIIYT